MGFRAKLTTAEDPIARAAAASAGELAADALWAAENGIIPGSRLAADAIDGRTITGATIRTTASSTGNRMLLDAVNGLRGLTGSTVNTQITPGGVLTATGATITGKTRTAASGARAEMSSDPRWGSAFALVGTEATLPEECASTLTRGNDSWGPATTLSAGTDEYGQAQGYLRFGFASGLTNPNGSRTDGTKLDLVSDVITLSGTQDPALGGSRRVSISSPVQINYVGDVDEGAGRGGQARPSLMIGSPTSLNFQADNNEAGFFNNGVKTGTVTTNEAAVATWELGDTGWLELGLTTGWTKVLAKYRRKNGFLYGIIRATRSSWSAGQALQGWGGSNPPTVDQSFTTQQGDEVIVRASDGVMYMDKAGSFGAAFSFSWPLG